MGISVNDFRLKGYQIFRGVVAPKAIAAVRDFLQRELDSALGTLQTLGVRGDAESASADINRLLAAPDADAIDRTLRSTMTGHYPLNTRLDPALWAIARDPGVRALLGEVLGADALRMHMPPTARFVLPRNRAAGVPAHQDISYNQHMSDFITMWVPLVEIDEACGGIRMFSRGQQAEMPTRLSHFGMWNEAVPTDGLEAVNCTPMHPGDVLIFDKFQIHQSMPNVSGRTRFSVDYRFFREADTSQKHYLDMQSWRVVAPN